MKDVKAVSVADIALVGLGNVGGQFLDEMLRFEDRGIKIVAVAELNDTPGRRRAEQAGIPVKTLDDIIAMGPAVDVVFDLTGAPAIRRTLRERMHETDNRHTIIAPETMARILWAMVSEEKFTVHFDRGY